LLIRVMPPVQPFFCTHQLLNRFATQDSHHAQALNGVQTTRPTADDHDILTLSVLGIGRDRLDTARNLAVATLVLDSRSRCSDQNLGLIIRQRSFV
jgi:hypothetical protein